MDLTRPVAYRGLQLNTASFDNTHPISGIELEQVDYSDVPGVGYTEKRAATDGFDASDVTLGMRSVVLLGTVYGTDRADLFDRLQDLRLAMSPTSAYAEDPGEYGYVPLSFDTPTKDARWAADPTTGVRYITQMLRVRPVRGLSFNLRRDAIGGRDVEGFAQPWQAQLAARDPRVYAQDYVDLTTLAGGATGSHSASWVNRGDYPSPVNILLATAAGMASDLTFTLQMNGSTMILTAPANASKAQILRYDGTHRVTTLQIDQQVSLRMDLMRFTQGTTHPLVLSGTNPFTWTRAGGAIAAGSHMWFWESWA